MRQARGARHPHAHPGHAPIFKVQDYGLSEIFECIRAIPGLRVAALTEAFMSEARALAWLRERPGS